ncbi:MAG TPA: heat-inducible transcriptional repressor HrcA [Longimicrobiales bacterium]|nr:heat-inducible transcriptional repressor HrcA [Longimicrobiales bacterium]
MSEAALTEREERVLDAVIRAYVETAEPAGSRTVAKRFRLGISPATVRNTMSDLEEKGFLFHPHTSAGRVPTDQAYRYYVDTLMRPRRLTEVQRRRLRRELGDPEAAGPLERLVRRATLAMGLLTGELGVAIAPSVDQVVLERLELLALSGEKVLLVLTLRNGIVRTVYVDLRLSVPRETLLGLAVVLNERLAGQTMAEIRQTLPDRLRDAAPSDDASATELLNIFLQSGDEFFDLTGDQVHLGNTSVLANQPEFESGPELRGLIELTERRELLARVLTGPRREGLQISIGAENEAPELTTFTLVTSEYRVGDLAGVIGVIGPTRMPYDKVVTIVESTSRIVSELFSTPVDGPGRPRE